MRFRFPSHFIIFVTIVILGIGVAAIPENEIQGSAFSSGSALWGYSVAVWHLDDSLVDSRLSNDLDGNGSIQYVSGLFQSDDYNSESATSLNTDLNTIRQADSNWSLSMWVYPYAGYTGTSGDFIVYQHGGAGEIIYDLYFGGGESLYFKSHTDQQTTGMFPPEEWTFVTIVHGDENLFLYTNGDLNLSISWGSASDSTNPTTFGNLTYSEAVDYFFNGTIEDVVAFNRALTASDVNELFKEYTGGLSIDFSYTPSEITLDYDENVDTASVDFNSSIDNTKPLSFIQWVVDGEVVADTNHMNYIFTVDGDYNVALIVGQDNNAQIAEKDKTVTVSMYPQDFNVLYYPTTPAKDEQVHFTLDANEMATTAKIKTLSVDYGDGNISLYDVENHLPYDFNHVFSGGGDHNIVYILSTINALNKQEDFNILVYGVLNIYFVDENTSSPLQPAVTIDGNDYSSQVDSNGLLSVILAGWENKRYTILASDTGKAERRWDIDMNETGDYNYTFTLLDTNKGTSVEFEFYSPDLDLLSNADITARISNDRYAWKQKTDSDGKITMFLNTNDSNYFFEILSETDDNYIYYATRVHSQIPKDEDTLANISPYNLKVGGLASQEYSSVASDLNVFILSNTVDYYSLRYEDSNSESSYFPRSYLVKSIGQTEVYELQPYLVNGEDGEAYAITIYVIDMLTRQTIEGVRIEVKRYIPGVGNVLVESQETDATGQAVFSNLDSETYALFFYYQGELVYSAEITIHDIAYYVYISFEIEEPEEVSGEVIDISFSPATGTIIADTDQNFEISQKVASNNNTITSLNIQVINDGNVIYDSNFSDSGGGTYTQDFNFYDLTTYNELYSHRTINVILTITSDANVTIATHTYSVVISSTYSLPAIAEIIKEHIGEEGAIILSLLLTIVVVSAFIPYVGLNVNILGLLGMILLGVFTAIGWVPLLLFIPMLLGSIIFYLRGVGRV